MDRGRRAGRAAWPSTGRLARRGQACGQTDGDENEAVAQNHPENLVALRTESEADADFDRAAMDAISEGAIKADADEKGCERSEEDGEAGDQCGHEVAFLKCRAERLGFVERDVGVELAHAAQDRREECEGIAGGAQFDVHIGDGASLGEVVPGHGHLLFIGARIFAVADDADDEGALVFAADDVTDGGGLGEVAFCEGLIDDGDEGCAEGVGVT